MTPLRRNLLAITAKGQ